MDFLFASRARSRPVEGVLFAEDFDDPHEAAHTEQVLEPAKVEPVYSANELASARNDAWAEGHAAGIAEARTASDIMARTALAAMADQIRATREDLTALVEQIAHQIAKTLMTMLATMLPKLCEDHGDAEALAIAAAILPHLRHEPRLFIRTHPRMAAALHREIERMEPGLMPPIEIVPTDALAAGDISLSWQDGGATRDTGALWRSVANILMPAGLLDHDPSGMSATASSADGSLKQKAETYV